MRGWSKTSSFLPRIDDRKSGRRATLPSRITSGLVLAVLLSCGGCLKSVPTCGGAEVKPTIANLFRRQFKLTPYVRYIDFDKSDLTVEAIFDIKQRKDSISCVAFVKYEAKLSDEGQRSDRRNDLAYSLLYELENEKQVYYTISLADDGKPKMHIDRVGG